MFKINYLILLSLLCSCNTSPIKMIKPDLSEKKLDSNNKAQDKHDFSKLEENNSKKTETKINMELTFNTKTYENTKKVQKYCTKIDKYFSKYNWGKSNCENFSWHHVRSSYLGNPIIWYVYGDEQEYELKNNKNVTLILCGVHGDEITPVKFCFDILNDIKKSPELIKDNLIVIAPIVTPDSFMKKNPTRTNARGIDVNRNFPTKDWNKQAIKLWKQRYGSNKRRYPGQKALSEQETIFQVNIINRYKPSKIISVHSPLTLIDYDGPSTGHKHGTQAELLLIQMSDKAGKYKINNYPFFTGSLGNWAGNERNIPTYTLELPNSDWNKTDRYFKTFRTAIHHAISHKLKAKNEITKNKN